MSDQPSKPHKRALPVVGKSLMPEVLPKPLHAGLGSDNPRTRVRKRLAQLTERAAALAAVASISSACAGGGGGYMTVDPAPSPAGTGGGGAPPFDSNSCLSPSTIAFSIAATWSSATSFAAIVAPTNFSDGKHFMIERVSADAGALVSVNGPFDLSVTATGRELPQSTVVHITFRCGDPNFSGVTYHLAIRFFTASPGTPGSDLGSEQIVEDENEDQDAGPSNGG